MLTPRQACFVENYILTGNGSEAARRAGFGERGAKVTASRLLTNANVAAAIRERQAQYQAELQITKDDVVAGILSAINMAREQQNPAAMISGCVQLAKLLGFYEPEVRRVELDAGATNLQAKFAAMSDAELLAVIASSS